MTLTTIIVGLVLLALGLLIGYFIRQQIAQNRASSVEAKLKLKVQQAKDEAREIIIEAKDKATKSLEEVKGEEKKKKDQLDKLEERLLKREEIMDKRQVELDDKGKDLEQAVEKIKTFKAELEKMKQSELETLEKLSGLNKDEAKNELFKRLEAGSHDELVQSMKKLETIRKSELEKKAQELMVSVMQRYARSNISEVTTSAVILPSEDLKGKIIGREGRNIRHFEKLTGVEVIVDESPETITLSSFDPVRREIAKVALEKLIQDGRIQPARIEDKINEAQKEMKDMIEKAGEDAAYEVGVLNLPPEIVHLLGRLAFRTSYGQNALLHSIEVATLARMMASELGANPEIAKAAGLLHDIGKAVDHEIEGAHLELGIRILQKYGISEDIIKAMRSHHENYPVESMEAALINAADALSAARPGARRETLENYLKRLTNLEKIATDFEGVEKAYAIQAGRELRIFVFPDKIDDFGAMKLARDVANKIESELNYPGEIKVTVFRETRVTEFAK